MGIEDYHVLGLVGEGSFGKVEREKKELFPGFYLISLILLLFSLMNLQLVWVKGLIVICFLLLD
jgi:hypothetical protein